MSLSKNSLKFIQVINDDPEKLEKIKSLTGEKEIYDYIVSIIPEFTSEDFEKLKDALYNFEKKEKEGILTKEQETQISGGSFLGGLEECLDSYESGKNSVRGISGSLAIITDTFKMMAAQFKKNKN